MHLPPMIHDLALILAIAGAVAIIFRRLNQPMVLGYLLAGILVGPHISNFPTVVDTVSIKVWAELGVIFLLFVLGLEFSFRKLLEVGKAALIAAFVEVVAMTALGYGVGRLLNWTAMDSLFLGGILAISSTTIIVKAFEEQGIKTQSFASLVFGILVIEDLFAILLLAVLSTVAASQTLEGPALLKQIGILLGLLSITIPLGLWITPRFFKFIRPQLNDETRVIVSLALCLLLVVASTFAGFSAALGAFLMGAFMGETPEGERVARFLKPIRDLFGAVFFISVGMLVDLQTVLDNLVLVAVISVITIAGKVISTTAGALAAHQDRRTSIQAGLSLGQIGEFSFIIATLGLTLNVVRSELYPLAVSVSLITTFSTPYLIRFASTSKWLNYSRGRKSSSKGAHLQLWDSHLVDFEIHPHFLFSGQTLQKLSLREKFGVSIVAIIRGDRKILAPKGSDPLMPFDRLVALGTDSQLAKLESYFQSERFDLKESDDSRFGVERLQIKNDYALVGKNLIESGIREKIDGLVLGIERAGERILNPDSNSILKAGDILWIYGPKDHVRDWQKEMLS